VDNEAAEALMSLGFTRQEAIAAVARHAREGMKTEDIVLAALKG
nr:Holliday junction branch migration protein RuvA [Clostridiales bacterium]